MIDQLWQKLLDRIRPAVRGQNDAFSARFSTSDVLQESAIQILREVEKSEAEEFDPPQAWLNRVGRGHASKLREHHSAQKRAKQRESPSEAVVHSNESLPPDEVVARREISSRIVLELVKLDSHQRTIIDRRFTKQESFAEIARQLDRPPEWVRRQYNLAIDQLRIALGESGEG